MSRRARACLLIVAILSAISILAGALQAAAGAAAGQAAWLVRLPGGPVGRPRIVNGIVQEVKTTAPRSITLRLGWHGRLDATPSAEQAPAASKTFPVSDQASVLVDGMPAALGDVQPGYRAALVLDVEGNAVTITAWSPGHNQTVIVRGWLVRLPALPTQTGTLTVQYYGLVPVAGALPGKGPAPLLPPGLEPEAGKGETAGTAGTPRRLRDPLHVILLLPKDAAAQTEMQTLLGQLVAVKGKWVASPTPVFGRAFEAIDLEALPWPPLPAGPKVEGSTT